MISHKHKYIFIHIPKTGGSSVEISLLGSEGITNPIPLHRLPEKHKQEYRVGGGKHDQHFPLELFEESYQKEYFCFTFVRNPWDMLVSEYLWIKKVRFSKSFYADVSFTQFVKLLAKGWAPAQVWHQLPSTDFINDNMDFIGRFENLQEDFNTICDKIGIPQQTLPHNNRSDRKHYTEYYDDETKDMIASKYALDIKCFGYEFGS